MFSWLKKTPRDRTACIAVVTSYGVTSAVVRHYAGEGTLSQPLVLFSCDEPIPDYHLGDAHRIEELALASLRRTLESCRGFYGTPDRLVCVLGEPWVQSFSRTTHVEKSGDFKVTRSLVDDAVTRESRLFEQEIVRDFADTEEVGIVDISEPLVDINGYRVSDYVGRMARTVDVRTVFSLAPTGFVTEVLGAFSDVFHREDTFMSSMDLARSLLVPRGSRGTVLEIGGMTSSLAIVEDGFVSYQALIPGGIFDVEASLSESFGVSRPHVSSVMEFASDEKLLQHQRDVYYERVTSAYKNFGFLVRRSLVDIQKQEPLLPRPFVVIGPVAWLSSLEALLAADTGGSVFVPAPEFFDEGVVYAHDARSKSVSLTLGILRTMRNLE